MPGHDRLRRRTGERRLAGECLVEDARQTVDVAATVYLPRSRRLLGRHVSRRANRESGFGELVPARRADGARDAEIGDNGVATREHDVFGLDIAMDDVVAVRVCQRFRHFPRDEQRVLDRQLRLSLQPVAEGFAFYERHDVVEGARGVAGVIDGQDVGVLQPGGQLDLAQEALAPQRHGDFGAQRLERDEALMPDIAGEVDHRHPAAAELPINDVVPGQRPIQSSKGISHRDNDNSGESVARARRQYRAGPPPANAESARTTRAQTMHRWRLPARAPSRAGR